MLRDMENLAQVAQSPWTATPLLALVIVVSCLHFVVSAEEYQV